MDFYVYSVRKKVFKQMSKTQFEENKDYLCDYWKHNSHINLKFSPTKLNYVCCVSRIIYTRIYSNVTCI